MINKEEARKAYQGGYAAYEVHKRLAHSKDGHMCNACYKPPGGYEGAFGLGWDAAERDWYKESKKILESLETEVREKQEVTIKEEGQEGFREDRK